MVLRWLGLKCLAAKCGVMGYDETAIYERWSIIDEYHGSE